MDSFKLNKIAGAAFGTCLFAMGLRLAGEAIYQPGPPAKPGYPLPREKEGGKSESAAAGSEAPAGVAPIAVRLASADAKRGEADGKVCGACHNFQEGAGAKVGPALYGVVDRPKGQMAGFDYSAALKAKGGEWSYDNLDQFLTKPSAYIAGTKMGYAGEASPEKRADIIAWLRTLAKAPAPLPQVSEADKAAAAKEASKEPPKDATKPEQQAKLEAPKGDIQKDANDAQGQADFLTLVGSSDPKEGQAAAQVCQACHNVTKGSGTLVGPTLWNVVARKKGSVAGFEYSDALKAKGGDWSVNDLNAWLTNPQAYIPGTIMGYPGEEDAKKRAAIVAYLRTLSDSPIALPGTAEGEAKAKEHSAGEANMSPAAKPGSQKPPAPPNKPDAAQPVPQSPEATSAAAGPTKPDQARPGMPQPAPTPDEPNGGKSEAGKSDAGKADAGKPAGEQRSEAVPSSQQAALPPAAPIAPAAGAAGEAGPEPYRAADPIAPPSEASSQQIAKGSTVSPSLTSAEDDKASDKGPEPYSAPSPGDGH